MEKEIKLRIQIQPKDMHHFLVQQNYRSFSGIFGVICSLAALVFLLLTYSSNTQSKKQEPSEETIFFAAQLAAYFSKGRNHPILPVDYTLRKHVKKSANAAAGMVTYTHFKTIFIGLTPEDMARILKMTGQA